MGLNLRRNYECANGAKCYFNSAQVEIEVAEVRRYFSDGGVFSLFVEWFGYRFFVAGSGHSIELTVQYHYEVVLRSLNCLYFPAHQQLVAELEYGLTS
jgi:hypothetical protein